MHAKPSLTAETVIAMIAFIDGKGGTHGFLAP